MNDAEVRAAAVTAASRAVESGAPFGHFLSTARLFARYIETGLSQTGPNDSQSVAVGVEGIHVRIDGLRPGDGDLARAIGEAVRKVLT